MSLTKALMRSLSERLLCRAQEDLKLVLKTRPGTIAVAE
ncbi:protein of unknown function [Shewanella benthica]|uniref:Uncharacterized protein n=1 Tax=Shewanella benthica TaxID=43661 RepID=A0A330M8I4_9GAMM|nr:protein of unknown function [Shewanella benthica]